MAANVSSPPQEAGGALTGAARRTNSVARAIPVGATSGKVGVRQFIEQSMWGRLFINNLWPALFFTPFFAARLVAVVDRLVDPAKYGAYEDPLHYQAHLANNAVTLLFIGLVVGLFAVRKPVKGKHADWRGGAVALAGTFLLNVVGLLSIPDEPSTYSLLASTFVVLVGTLFSLWSLAVLGRCFGIFPEARGLVTRGPYRWIRHPIYLGHILGGFGLVISKPYPEVIVLFVVFVGLEYWRAVYEERALEETFPAEYAAYRARTGRLLPRWR